MKFTILFEVTPAWAFGVPEEGFTVVPGGKRKRPGASYHVATMLRVSHGTLPQYRQQRRAIQESFSFQGVDGRFDDNFVTIVLEASNPDAAFFKANHALSRLLEHLSISHDRPFSASPSSSNPAIAPFFGSHGPTKYFPWLLTTSNAYAER
jgi:hypothetical protein